MKLGALIAISVASVWLSACNQPKSSAPSPEPGRSAKAAKPSDTFDLLCDLNTKLETSASSPALMGKKQVRVRLDLTKDRWCDGDCRETKRIAAATDDAIVLTVDEYDRRINAYEVLKISRETGEYLHRSRIGEAFFEAKGTCKPAPFSGFPAKMF